MILIILQNDNKLNEKTYSIPLKPSITILYDANDKILHMQGVPFYFLSNVLNFKIFSVVSIPLLIEFHNLAPSYIKHFFAMSIRITFRQR